MEAPTQRARSDQSLGSLFRKLSHESLTLMRQEVEFAKLEMAEKAVRGARRSVLLAIGGSFAFVGFQVLVFAAIIALSKVFSALMSAIIVGVIVVNSGLFLLAVGYWQLKNEDFMPQRTTELLKEEGEWLKDEMTS